MNDSWSRIKADLRYWVWKARTHHTQRYVSLIVVLAVVVGVVFFSNGGSLFKPNTARAALGATYAGGTLTIDGGGKYMLTRDATCGTGSSLWPLNYASSNAIISGGANFKGKLCIAATDTVLVQSAGTELSLVGNVALGNVTVNSGAKITSAPSDAHGKAAPFSSRPNYFTTRFTGFLALQSGHNYTLRPSASTDDTTMIETGNPAVGTSIDSGGTFPTVVGSVLVGRNGAGACNYDPTWRTTAEICGGTAGFLPPATLYNGGNPGNSIVLSNPGPNPLLYVPIRVSSYEITGDAFVGLTWTDNGVSVRVPVSSLYAPIETAGGGAGLGTVDINAQNKMRFEYGTGPLGNGAAAQIARDLSNASEYTFVSRADLTSGGTFNGFGKQASGGTNDNNFNFYWYQSSDFQTAGSPLSNSQRNDGLGYLIGADPTNIANVALMQNYALQTEGTNVAGAPAGIHLTAANLVITAASIDVNGKGLPGGIQFYPNWTSDHGVSGVGGRGQGSSPGWWIDAQQSGSDHSYAGHWDVHGGGGGAANKSISPGPGGGGGGVIGYGSAGMATDINGVLSILPNHTDSSTDKVKNYGAGGGGFKGVGGGSNGNFIDYYTNNSSGANVHDRYNGSSNRGAYDPSIAPGMGGGGGQGSGGEDKSYHLIPAPAGGGIIQISVTGGLTMLNAAAMDASGGSPSAVDYGPGAGGAGTVDISVPNGSFDLSNDSLLIARGGSTPLEASPNKGDPKGYPEGGLGGGGLIRVRAQTYGPAANGGWPASYCDTVSQPFKAFFSTGANPNLDARGGGQGVPANIANYSTQAEDGLIDIAYYVSGNAAGSTFCGGSNGTSADVQIAKQIQQWNGSNTFGGAGGIAYQAAIQDTSTYWSDSVTTVPGTIIRVRISVRNPDPNNARSVNVNDTLPAGLQMVDNGAGKNMNVRTVPQAGALGTLNAAPGGIVGGAVTANNVAIPKNSTVEVSYIAKVVSL